MTLCRHIRRPEPMPRGAFYHIECDCGWAGKVPYCGDSGQALTDAAEALWLAHVPPRERRTYLLLDTRAPDDFQSLGSIKEQLRDDGCAGTLLETKAKLRFESQLPIRGNFLMPEGTAVFLKGHDERDGMFFGRFSLEADGPEQELPIGEIRTTDGRVWRAE